MDGRARRLNRALLARQGLLEPIDEPLPETLERIGGIQAQYAPSMYIGLWSRLARFERDQLTRALEAREVIQATLMRGTIHLVSRADFWPLALAIRGARRRLPGVKPGDEEAVRAVLAGGAMRRKELEAVTAPQVHLWTDLVRVPPSGTWERRRADLYAAAEDWIGPPPPVADPVRHLVERYLGGFGPASRKDIASFTGLTPTQLAPALEGLVAYDDELLDLHDAPMPDPETPAPVRLLPTWDATLLVHARRAQILPEEHRPRIFNTKMPQSIGTFLVDGAVAGTWRPDGTIEAFEHLSAKQRKAVDAEGRRLIAFCT